MSVNAIISVVYCFLALRHALRKQVDGFAGGERRGKFLGLGVGRHSNVPDALCLADPDVRHHSQGVLSGSSQRHPGGVHGEQAFQRSVAAPPRYFWEQSFSKEA